MKQQLKERLYFIYKNDAIAEQYSDKLISLINNTRKSTSTAVEKWNEKDAILITYGDSIKNENEIPLHSLTNFVSEHIGKLVSYIHILPFFPFSSDDGFSVIDYKMVDPQLGSWKEIGMLTKQYSLMTDLVINHISSKSRWFQNYLQGQEPENAYFIEADPQKDYSKVTRPRSLPLLSEYETSQGKKHLWTTFSADQVDLNFANPEVLYEMTAVLLHYLKNGAKIIRLDAIAFLWKEDNSTCLHLPETHEVVKLLRNVMEAVDPHSILLTETNVPNKENMSYFGNGDEAHMVYQFSLPPLLLHALHTGNSRYLTEWSQSVPQPGKNCTFFNFTASHDGIGVRPLEGLLPQHEFDTLVDSMKSFGGHISTKKNSDGSDSPYEMNITYFDACKGTSKGTDDKQIARFICSQTVMMTLKGIPAFYIHSFTATPNYYNGVKETGRARTINRMKWNKAKLECALQNEGATKTVFHELKRLLAIRRNHKAFHPDSLQEIVVQDPALFIVKRKTIDNSEILSLSNISDNRKSIDIAAFGSFSHDVISNTHIDSEYIIEPYQTLWLVS